MHTKELTGGTIVGTVRMNPCFHAAILILAPQSLETMYVPHRRFGYRAY